MRLTQISLPLTIAGALLGTRAHAGQAQARYESPAGHVEVLGLRHWTLQMLRDSIRRYAAGQDLSDAACMITLREQLHFADASVEWYDEIPAGGRAQSYLLVKVIEPQQAHRVQWDMHHRSEFSSLAPDYASLVLPLTDSLGQLMGRPLKDWLPTAPGGAAGQATPSASETERDEGARFGAFLHAHGTENDRVRALRILHDDGFWVNRMVAATILTNFPASDSTWWSLVRALRDPNEAVRETAASVLNALPRRTIAWDPVAADLRLLLGGTNLSGMQGLFTTLTATHILPTLAPRLLRGNADWVLAHLAATTPKASEPAHHLLMQLNRGVDLGTTPRAWERWAAKL